MKESGKQSIQNLALGIKILTELKSNVLLRCECRKTKDSHRRLISQQLKEQEIKVAEITEQYYNRWV